MNNNLIDIITRLPAASLYEQLAEECAELAHDALKLARIIRQENPTPQTKVETTQHLIEELSDVSLVCDVIGIEPDQEIKARKLQRWAERLEEAGS